LDVDGGRHVTHHHHHLRAADPTHADTATFRFSADEDGVTFTCQLDAGAETECTSPKTYSGVALGDHTFTVFGTDPAGNDGKTDTWRWTRN
jgi:hypothetical protein